MPDVQTSWIHIFPWILCICNRETSLLIVRQWSDDTIFMHLKNLINVLFLSQFFQAVWQLETAWNGSLGTLGPVYKKCMKTSFFGISWYNLATIYVTEKSKQTFTKMSRKWPFLTLKEKKWHETFVKSNVSCQILKFSDQWLKEGSVNFEMSLWCLQILPKNKRKQVDLFLIWAWRNTPGIWGL